MLPPMPFLNSPHRRSGPRLREIDVVMGKEVEAEGAALRALHIFLREVDKTQHWCGLKRVRH